MPATSTLAASRPVAAIRSRCRHSTAAPTPITPPMAGARATV